MNSKDTVLQGFRRITDTENGSIQDVTNTWGGVLSLILRRIIKDNYDGKGVEGYPQMEDESLIYSQMTEIIEEALRTYSGNTLDQNKITAEKARLLKELSRETISIKYLGELFHILDLPWVDITITMQRKSGTIKSYTAHVGGVGLTQYVRPVRNQELIDQQKLHEESAEINHELYSLGKQVRKESNQDE